MSHAEPGNLSERAARETGGNVSALVDRLARHAQLAEALAAEDAESDRYAA
jgi:hypothetical protein